MNRLTILLLCVFFSVFIGKGVHAQGVILGHHKKEKKEKPYGDADRHGTLFAWSLISRTGDLVPAMVDTIKLNTYHRSYIEGMSPVVAYTGIQAGPALIMDYFARPVDYWNMFFFTNIYEHLMLRGKTARFFDTKTPYSYLSYLSSGSEAEKEQSLGVVLSTNIGRNFNLGLEVDLDKAEGIYYNSAAKNVAYRVFFSYTKNRYEAYVAVSNTNVINQENGGLVNMRYITHPDDFNEGRRSLLNKDIPTKYRNMWNRVKYGEGRLHHRYRFGFYQDLDKDGRIIEQAKEKKLQSDKLMPPNSTELADSVLLSNPSGRSTSISTLSSKTNEPLKSSKIVGKDTLSIARKEKNNTESDSLNLVALSDIIRNERDTTAQLLRASQTIHKRDSLSSLASNKGVIFSDTLPKSFVGKREKITPVSKKGNSDLPSFSSPTKKRGRRNFKSREEGKKEQEEKKKRIRFVPVTSVFHDFYFQKGSRRFVSNDHALIKEYPNPVLPRLEGVGYYPFDFMKAYKVSNTLGVELMEGFHKWAKIGLAAFVAFDYERYIQPLMTKEDAFRLNIEYEEIRANRHSTYIGGRLSSNSFKYLKYYAWGQIGVEGAHLGEIDIRSHLTTSFKLWGKEVNLIGRINFLNNIPTYFLRSYKATLREWSNDLIATQTLRLESNLSLPFTQTELSAHVETIQNPIAAMTDGNIGQYTGNFRAVGLSLKQKLSFWLMNLDFHLIGQRSSNSDIAPLPLFSGYANAYLKFKVAKVLTLQTGVDAMWHTKYYAPYYEPTTQVFKPQNDVLIGGETPMMTAYVNAHLSRARFYVRYHNIGALLFRPNSFTMPYYPTTPPMMQTGIMIDLLD